MRWSAIAILPLLVLIGCGGESDGGGDCASLSMGACEASEACMPLMAWDVTRTGAGGSCWEGPAGDWGDPVYLRCVLTARGSGALAFGYDSSGERCYAFESSTSVPSGWRECSDVLPQCTCRSDADCSDGRSCIYYGEHEQSCTTPSTEPVACDFGDFPVTGEPCTESDRGVACRPFFCDSGCSPTCTCTAELRWSCEPEVCIPGPDGGTGGCGSPPSCDVACLP